MFAAWAIANKCKTAFVEPSSAMTVVMAFSKDFKERISDGFMSLLISSNTAAPAA